MKYYLDESYSLKFRTRLYHLNTAIGTGEVGRAVGAVGLGFIAVLALPILIELGAAQAIVTDIVVGEVVDKISAAVGLPIGEILAFKDIKH